MANPQTRFPISGILLKRYKRFLADVQLENGEIITAHCPNSGRMTSCVGDHWPVLLTEHLNTKRKLPYTLEYTFNGDSWIGVNTHQANTIVKQAIEAGAITELLPYTTLETEVAYDDNSRIDILLTHADGKKTYIEVKSVTLKTDDGQAAFPDAVSTRGQKHLEALARQCQNGHRAVLLFLTRRLDTQGFRAAQEIDPAYAQKLEHAVAHGVEIIHFTDPTLADIMRP